MSSVCTASETDLQLYELLEEFMTLLRRRQGVSVREFARRNPAYSDRILSEFPALLMAEGLKPRLSAAPGTSGILFAEEPPELLAGYRVIRQIGQGGMGVVYEAEHPHLSRRMAIKILPGRRENTTLGERFRREAESASRLNHPNIVPVYDFGSQNGVQYLTMPLVNGRSLDRILDEYRSRSSVSAGGSTIAGQQTDVPGLPGNDSGPLTQPPFDNLIGPNADFRRLATLGADAASALAHAHANGTIHRDIKPGNLILDDDGKIWITDFGLAKVRNDSADLSRTGDVIGTPRFMAPEQLRGLCDERSDVYSLGVTLYEMASGQRAWELLTSAQLMKVRATSELPELSERAPFVPQPLADIIMKACSFRQEDRYQSAQELQTVLNRFAHGQKTGDRRRRPRHNSSFLDRRWVMLSCFAGLPAVILVVLFWFQVGPFGEVTLPTPESLVSLVQDESNREKIVEELPDIIVAAITSKDEDVRREAADLTLTVLDEAFKKSEMKPAARETALSEMKTITDEYKKSGFVYDKMNHPLTNAIRNLKLADQIAALRITAEEKLTAQGKIAFIGEALRGKFVTDQQAKTLLAILPSKAQSGPCTETLSEAAMLRFVRTLDSVYETARRRFEAEPQKQMSEISTNGSSAGVGSPGAPGTELQIPKGIKIPQDLKIPEGIKVPAGLKIPDSLRRSPQKP